MQFQRSTFIIVLGIILFPLAGYIGLLAMPSAAIAWLLSFMALPFSVAILAPFLTAAKYAWLLTCVIFPLIAHITQPASFRTPFLYLAIGIVGGVISFYPISFISDPVMSAASRYEFARAAGLAGAVLGLIFGYALWRFDKGEHQQAPALPIPSSALKLGALLSIVFLIAAVAILAALPSQARRNVAAENVSHSILDENYILGRFKKKPTE